MGKSSKAWFFAIGLASITCFLGGLPVKEDKEGYLMVYGIPRCVTEKGALEKMERAIRERVFLAGMDWVKVKKIGKKVYLSVPGERRGDLYSIRSLVERSGDLSLGVLEKSRKMEGGAENESLKEAIRYWEDNLVPSNRRWNKSFFEIKKIPWEAWAKSQLFWIIGDEEIVSDGSFKGYPRVRIKRNEWDEELPVFPIKKILFPINEKIERVEPYSFQWGESLKSSVTGYALNIFLKEDALKRITGVLDNYTNPVVCWILDGILVSGEVFVGPQSIEKRKYLVFNLLQLKHRFGKKEILYVLYTIMARRIGFTPKFIGIFSRSSL